LTNRILTDRKQAHTQTAYAADLTAWRSWCLTGAPEEYRVHPLLATRPHVDAWADHRARTFSARTGRPLSPASVARRLSALSNSASWPWLVLGLSSEMLRTMTRPGTWWASYRTQGDEGNSATWALEIRLPVVWS
jgi:hypothetical protein